MDYDEHVLKEIEEELPMSSESIAQEAALIVFGLFGISANVLLIYIICRFSQLHTNTNTYLINWAIATIGLTISSITCFDLVVTKLRASYDVIFVFYDLEVDLALIVTFFMILMTLEWCLASHFPRWSEKFKKYSNYIIACTWLFFTIYFIASAATNAAADHYYTFFIVLFAVLAVFVIVLHIIRFAQKFRGAFEYNSVSSLMVPTVFVLCWFLGWLTLLILLYFDLFISVLAWITDPPIFLHPVINVALLTFIDSDFRKCVFHTTQSFDLFKAKPQGRQGSNVNPEIS